MAESCDFSVRLGCLAVHLNSLVLCSMTLAQMNIPMTSKIVPDVVRGYAYFATGSPPFSHLNLYVNRAPRAKTVA